MIDFRNCEKNYKINRIFSNKFYSEEVKREK